jgi:hypothetical protein
MRRDVHYRRCHAKDSLKNRKGDEPFFYSTANHIDFGDVPAFLPELSPVEEMFIARVHVSVYDQLPLLPTDLAVVILWPRSTNGNP